MAPTIHPANVKVVVRAHGFAERARPGSQSQHADLLASLAVAAVSVYRRGGRRPDSRWVGVGAPGGSEPEPNVFGVAGLARIRSPRALFVPVLFFPSARYGFEILRRGRTLQAKRAAPNERSFLD